MRKVGDPHIARVQQQNGSKILAFNKANTRDLPPSFLEEPGATVRVWRDGCPFSINEQKLRASGLCLKDLKEGDRVEVVSVNEFYQRLMRHNELHPGMIVWIDPALKAEFEFQGEFTT